MTDPDARRRWADRQVAELIDAGDDPLDAEKFVAQALAMIPPDADPETWVPTAVAAARMAQITDTDIEDARADWYASDDVPARFKRLLDAKEAAR